MDVVYFGNEDDETSLKYQTDFIKEVKEKFPDVVLKDAYNEYKGYRQEVYLDDKEIDNYNAFLIGKAWYEMSLTMQIIMRTEDKRENFLHWIELAKSQYPESFKSNENNV